MGWDGGVEACGFTGICVATCTSIALPKESVVFQGLIEYIWTQRVRFYHYVKSAHTVVQLCVLLLWWQRPGRRFMLFGLRVFCIGQHPDAFERPGMKTLEFVDLKKGEAATRPFEAKAVTPSSTAGQACSTSQQCDMTQLSWYLWKLYLPGITNVTSPSFWSLLRTQSTDVAAFCWGLFTGVLGVQVSGLMLVLLRLEVPYMLGVFQAGGSGRCSLWMTCCKVGCIACASAMSSIRLCDTPGVC